MAWRPHVIPVLGRQRLEAAGASGPARLAGLADSLGLGLQELSSLSAS